MQAYLLHGPQDLRLTEKPIPDLQPDGVLVRTCFTGICGSDVHYYREGFCGRFVPKHPFALGHEFSGVVRQKGADVDNVNVGDSVAVDPCIPCGRCGHCRGGDYNLCTNMKVLGSASSEPHLDGGLGQFVAVPARNCFVLPEGIDRAQASLLEPLCVALHAVGLAGGIGGRSVLITGGGPIGQLVLRVVRAFGALRTCMSDVDAFARQFASESGATTVLDPADHGALAASEAYDIVFEASGSPAALASALEVIRAGGTLVQIGTLPEVVPVPANLIMTKQLRVFGSFRYAHVFETAMAMVAAGAVSLEGIVSEVYGFERVPEAMQRALKREHIMKVQIAQ
jgi:L-idonate 5-dehydrogenase